VAGRRTNAPGLKARLNSSAPEVAIGVTRAGEQEETVQELRFGAGVALLVDDLAAAELKMEAALAEVSKR